MTGAYLRVHRDGIFIVKEVEHLTPLERRGVLKDEMLHKWLDLTCDVLQKQQTLMDSLVEEGILERS